MREGKGSERERKSGDGRVRTIGGCERRASMEVREREEAEHMTL